MRASRKAGVGDETPSLQMTPLIDIVFLMLSYFLFTMSLGMLEGVLPSKLAVGEDQSQQEREEEPPQQVIVRLVQNGDKLQYFLDDWPVANFERLTERLAGLPVNTMVVISAAPAVRTAPVVRTYNQCLKFGLTRIVFPVSS